MVDIISCIYVRESNCKFLYDHSTPIMIYWHRDKQYIYDRCYIILFCFLV